MTFEEWIEQEYGDDPPPPLAMTFFREAFRAGQLDMRERARAAAERAPEVASEIEALAVTELPAPDEP